MATAMADAPMPLTDRLRLSALRYAEAGFPIIPLYAPNGSGCSCKLGASCEHPGKHPRTRNGLKDASLELAKVDAWWRQWPDANIGLVLPRDIVAVDIDSPDALDGFDEHPEMELPETWNVTTGRGWHYIYRTEHPIKGTTNVLPGIDLRGFGNYLVAPPSRHASGLTYKQNSSMLQIAPAPAWITDRQEQLSAVGSDAGPIPQGARDATLASLGGSMRRRGMGEEAILAALLLENRARCIPPLPDADVERIAHSVARYAPEPAPFKLVVAGDNETPGPGGATRSLADFSIDPPPPMLIDRLDPSGHTILYGAGGVGKGTYACWLALRLTQAGQRVLIIDYEHHPEEWSRRVFGLGGVDEMAMIRYIAPLSASWQGSRGPLWQSAGEIRGLCGDEGITVCIVDSLAIACAGADVSDPGTPALYAAGLELIERPVLSLAHVNRAGDMAYPFGSAFWHNLARVTWSLESDGPRAILSPRKSNNYIRAAKVSMEIVWTDGLPREIGEKGYSETIANRIWEVLGAEALTVKEIATRLDEVSEEGEQQVKVESVRRVLNRDSRVSPRFVKRGEQWSRVA